MRLLVRICVAAIVVATVVSPARAQQPGGPQVAASTPPLLSPSQRTALSRELIARWQGEVSRTPGGSVAAWSSKIIKAVAVADAANVLQATSMTSLSGMHAALNGYDLPSPTVSSTSIGNGAVQPQALGSPTADLVYTPLPNGRCQIANSSVVNTPTTANTVRSIDVEDITSYAAQGGTGTFANGDGSTNCGIPDFTIALALMVSVSGPAESGNLRVFAADQVFQTGNRLLYTGGSFGENSDMIVRSCVTCALEISIYSTTSVHYSITVLGYFMPPQATALECVTTAETVEVVEPSTTEDTFAPACPSGYTAVSVNCGSSSYLMPLVFVSGSACSARNATASNVNLKASQRCCRVPGR